MYNVKYIWCMKDPATCVMSRDSWQRDKTHMKTHWFGHLVATASFRKSFIFQSDTVMKALLTEMREMRIDGLMVLTSWVSMKKSSRHDSWSLTKRINFSWIVPTERRKKRIVPGWQGRHPSHSQIHLLVHFLNHHRVYEAFHKWGYSLYNGKSY